MEENLDLLVNREMVSVMYAAVEAYYEKGNSEVKQKILASDAMELLNFANMYFQSEEE